MSGFVLYAMELMRLMFNDAAAARRGKGGKHFFDVLMNPTPTHTPLSPHTPHLFPSHLLDQPR